MTATHQGTPPRTDHPEILDDRTVDPAVVRRSMRDVALSNRLFGGTRAVLQELDAAIDAVPASSSLLDVGTGVGDIPAAAASLARRRGTSVFTIGLDASPALARESRARVTAAVVADAGALPFRDCSVDVVTCSQLLHHFSAPSAAAIVRELDRVARSRVIVSDIRRSRLAVAGLWLASFALRFHPVSRHDGVASIRRGFSAAELRSLLLRALGRNVQVRRHPGFRVTAAWTPALSTQDERR
ncbi:MAG TPA: methyltransferase domain-containing protein [Gemmatimonadaceae bacterium]